MKQALHDVARAYREALTRFLEDDAGDELLRVEAYHAGRALVAAGHGLLDLAEMHGDALGQSLAVLGQEAAVGPVYRAVSFLAEGLSPFEMALRGFQDANETLQGLNETLEARVAERTAALETAEARYRHLVEAGPAHLYTTTEDPRGRVLYVSPGGRDLLGGDDRAARLAAVHPADRDALARAFAAVDEGGEGTCTYRLGEGKARRWVRDHARRVHDPEGPGTRIHGILLDVTEQHHLQDTLNQVQKLDGIGRLAGGIAHDFNNLLTAILTYGELAHSGLEEGHPVREDLDEIGRVAMRAADLTRQLLAFSRRQILEPKVLDPNARIREMEKLLRRLIEAHVALELDLSETAGRVRMDPVQLEQVVLNLVVNARDAVADGGRIRVRSRGLALAEGEVPGLDAGRYVEIAVEDDGPGIPDDIRDRIFEPFFTTKAEGKGTGLGLATCYGIVTQSGGTISVDSVPGTGTTFRVRLPRSDAPQDDAAAALADAVLHGTETILLVEDDEGVRRGATRVLRDHGYRVDAVPSADAALVHLEAAGPPDLLITDVVLPGAGGPKLAAAVRARHPRVRVLFTSGYGDESLTGLDTSEAGPGTLLRKPFRPEALLRALRARLDA